jgi:glycosyltransferase involved in cell wall biosynthesis
MNPLKKPAITVVTPTYNRAYCLDKVFESLENQTFRDFEWIIVDDGSTDTTEDVAAKFICLANFPIKYIKKTNGGKHTAVNKALEVASGELFLIFDSDDRCTADSLEFMFFKWRELSLVHPDLAGITTLSITPHGVTIGSKFPFDGQIDYLYQFYQKYNIVGDKWDIHATKILRLHPFPEITGQKFCPESLVWNRIAKNYKTAFFNKPTKIAVYLDDGLSKNLTRIRMKYPALNIVYYRELSRLEVSSKAKFYAATNFVRFTLHNSSFLENFFSNPIFCLIGFFTGYILYFRDKLEASLSQ